MADIGKLERDVFICDGNQAPLGSGVLLVPKDYEYVFVLTAAHLFRHKNAPSAEYVTLNIYSSFLRNKQYKEGATKNLGRIKNVECDIFTMDEEWQSEEGPVILIHSKYDPQNCYSPCDHAIVRMEREKWMNGISMFSFPKIFEERIALCGYGYPCGGYGEQLRREGDFFSGRSNFECSSSQNDEMKNEIIVSHGYERDRIKLEGFSGTGIFDTQGKFYGVIGRRYGNDEAPDACILSSWKGFDEILQIFGWVPTVTDVPEEDILTVDLKVTAHWLLDKGGDASKDLLDDRKTINLASLLFGMTDSYVVVLATVWRNGIAAAMERILDEFAAKDNRRRESLGFPMWKEQSSLNYTERQGEGLVMNIKAVRPDLLSRVREILKRHENENMPLILNVWSDRPEEALSAVAGIYEDSKLRTLADYLSVVECRQQSVEKDFSGYQTAQTSRTAIQQWLGAQSAETAEALFQSESMYGVLDQDKIDDLTVHLWIFMRDHFNNEEHILWDYFQRMRGNCSEHTLQLLNVLEGQCEMNHIADLLKPGDIQVWAELAAGSDFEKGIRDNCGNPVFYWIAIMRNVNGCEYVLRERLDRRNDRFISRLLDRFPNRDRDEIIETQASFIRDYLRPE